LASPKFINQQIYYANGSTHNKITDKIKYRNGSGRNAE